MGVSVPERDERDEQDERAAPKRKARPAFVLIIVVTVVLRLGREVIGRVAFDRYGGWAILALVIIGAAIALSWRAWRRWRVRRRGGAELTPEDVRDYLHAAGMTELPFDGDGTLLGTPVMLVSQRPKVIEVETAYDVFGPDGQLLGTVSQIAQSRGKAVARVLTGFDQFFTHHFDIADAGGTVVLRLTRPRKIFLTKLHVFTGDDRFVGTIRQHNVFGKIRFGLTDAAGITVGELRAQNLRAWDFRVLDANGATIATIFKSWEGWAQTALTRADRYGVRIERPLEGSLRDLTVASALAVDLALKQDARGIG